MRTTEARPSIRVLAQQHNSQFHSSGNSPERRDGCLRLAATGGRPRSVELRALGVQPGVMVRRVEARRRSPRTLLRPPCAARAMHHATSLGASPTCLQAEHVCERCLLHGFVEQAPDPGVKRARTALQPETSGPATSALPHGGSQAPGRKKPHPWGRRAASLRACTPPAQRQNRRAPLRQGRRRSARRH